MIPLPTAGSGLRRRYHKHLSPYLEMVGPSRITGLTGLDFDLAPNLLPMRDQGSLGDCFAFATEAHTELAKKCKAWLSAAFVAWKTRVVEGTFPTGRGACVADSMAVANTFGICPEDMLRYDEDPGEKGDIACEQAALAYRIGIPCTVDLTDLDNVRAVLGAGKTIVVGAAIYENFERTAHDGVVPAKRSDDRMLGGHAMLICGLKGSILKLRNSWGEHWGDHGYCFWPASDLVPHTFESWTSA